MRIGAGLNKAAEELLLRAYRIRKSLRDARLNNTVELLERIGVGEPDSKGAE
jgi:hypothetical protein